MPRNFKENGLREILNMKMKKDNLLPVFLNQS